MGFILAVLTDSPPRLQRTETAMSIATPTEREAEQLAGTAGDSGSDSLRMEVGVITLGPGGIKRGGSPA